MEELEKNIRINLLFDIYGALLSKTQAKMIALYYQDDLSLGEISELEGVTRNAVHDSIKKGTKALEDYEAKIGVLAHNEKMDKLFEELKERKLTKEELELVLEIERKEHE